jgi:RNA recognition motif-containing protein
MCFQVKDLVKPFGELISFHLLKDPDGVSKGTAVFEYADRSGAEMAIKGLDGTDMFGTKLQLEVRYFQRSAKLAPSHFDVDHTGTKSYSGAEMAIKGLNGTDIAGKKLQVKVRLGPEMVGQLVLSIARQT